MNNLPTTQTQSVMPVAQNASQGAMVATQAKAVQEIQAAILVSRQFPRDENYSLQKVMKQCETVRFAEKAMYGYSKGGTLIEGASIRLAESVARNWGNLSFGWEILQETGDGAHVRAFCWDMESNVSNDIKFYVPYERKAHGSIKKIFDARERYEHVANMATRRLRACIMRVVPMYVFEEAIDFCKRTLEKGGINVDKLLTAFAKFGVTKKMIETRIGHSSGSISNGEAVQLRTVYQSIKDGFKDVGYYFNVESPQPESLVSFKQPKTPAGETINTETGEVTADPPKKAPAKAKAKAKVKPTAPSEDIDPALRPMRPEDLPDYVPPGARAAGVEVENEDFFAPTK